MAFDVDMDLVYIQYMENTQQLEEMDKTLLYMGLQGSTLNEIQNNTNLVW